MTRSSGVWITSRRQGFRQEMSIVFSGEMLKDCWAWEGLKLPTVYSMECNARFWGNRKSKPSHTYVIYIVIIAKSKVDRLSIMLTTANPIERKPGGMRVPRSVLFLCSPTLLGLILFAFAFPLRRHVPVSTNWTYADIFFIWCVLIAPLSTVGAIALFFSKEYRHRQSSFGKIFGVLILVATIVVNSYLAYAMWAAVYF